LVTTYGRSSTCWMSSSNSAIYRQSNRGRLRRPVLVDSARRSPATGDLWRSAGTLLSNVGVLHVFGINDHDSARLASNLLG
jgi:hypothetical protein